MEGNALNALINRLRGVFIGRDEGIPLPFCNYDTLLINLSAAAHNAAIVSLPRTMQVVSWTQSVYPATPIDSSNYWTISLVSANNGTTASFTTVGMTAVTWNTVRVTSFSNDLAGAFALLYATKTGSPGNVALSGPLVLAM